ncbi:response regulator transcription factor [Brumimicrobium oceani]|uniref:DNA-binding response regulator n=1 Tax=Brumimicrobium oceani TaxID=2100725 RepID=A0A2U2XBI4_9FLAO|nr:response regulator transcription factor [Brumimicrobium oceani]PWH85156.1 DNA-binding response regulator [Brumimicrobium oceani]
MPRIVIADDHPLLLEGLYNHLIKLGYTNLSKAVDGSEALRLIQEEQADIAILDIEMPFMDGLSVAKHCQEQDSTTKFIILSYHKEPEFIVQAKSLNIAGYILKEDVLSEIANCIRTIIDGEQYYSKVFKILEEGKVKTSLNLLENLSPSELKILKLIAQSYSTRDISKQLFISERTVEKHRSNIIIKLNLKGKTNSLFAWAIKNKGVI